MNSRLLSILISLVFILPASAQWTNRYPKVQDHGHHVYLEGFELPILTSGPMDPAPAPLNNQLAFAAKGWLWLLDLQTMAAKRITSSPGMDSRPEWSSDGKKLVFIRDDGSDTHIVVLDLITNNETVLIDEPAIDLDPFFSPDRELVYYASAVNGSIDLWSINLSTGERQPITDDRGVQRRPVAHPGGSQLIYLNKIGSYNSVVLLDLESGTERTLVEDRLTSQADMTLNNDGTLMAYTWPYDGGYEIRLLTLDVPNSSLRLTVSEGMPLAPAFSGDGRWIYYAEAGENERTELKRISVNGGNPEIMEISSWDWDAPKGKIKIITKVDGVTQPVRLNVTDATGHPVIPDEGAVRSDGQNGMVFFYSNGEIILEAPEGAVEITAVQGFLTEATVQKTQVRSGTTEAITIELERIWHPNASGWYSGDNHFHLNYGGTYQLDPEDIMLDMKGEGLDVAFPLLANLHNRFLQQELWGWKNEGLPMIRIGQEVRSHFLGHLSLIGTTELYWPWIWGPFYEVYGKDDRTNAAPLRFARSQGGLGGYVHPVRPQNPFSEEGAQSVPVSLVADCVLGEVDLIEVGCLWTDELGTGSMWHQILNIGVPLAASSGSDVMNDYYRTMAVGAARVFVKPKGELTEESYLDALKNGQSFVSNGPMLEFLAGDKGPGEVIETDSRSFNWSLSVHSALPYDKVEIYINGAVVWAKEVNVDAGSHNYKGSLKVPVGGWVTARVHGGAVKWPFMDSYPFAEASPVWFGEVGSTDPQVAKVAAAKLLKVLKVSRESLIQGYGETPIPNLISQFDRAEDRLKEIVNSP